MKRRIVLSLIVLILLGGCTFPLGGKKVQSGLWQELTCETHVVIADFYGYDGVGISPQEAIQEGLRLSGDGCHIFKLVQRPGRQEGVYAVIMEFVVDGQSTRQSHAGR